MSIYAVILAGGFGTRLAPLSTSDKPKQFHDLTGEGMTLFQQTILRALEITDAENIFPVVNKQHRNLATLQIAIIDMKIVANMIFEDEPRNTAYAINTAVKQIHSGIIIAMPSDHEISGEFAHDVAEAVKLAEQGKIVTFGIQPTQPDSNFGYVQGSSFYEKPDSFEAEKLIAKGALWNSGIFVFQSQSVLGEFEKFYGGEDIPAISFDKAIMEKTDKLAMIKANFAWADLGNWQTLKNHPAYELHIKEKEYA